MNKKAKQISTNKINKISESEGDYEKETQVIDKEKVSDFKRSGDQQLHGIIPDKPSKKLEHSSGDNHFFRKKKYLKKGEDNLKVAYRKEDENHQKKQQFNSDDKHISSQTLPQENYGSYAEVLNNMLTQERNENKKQNYSLHSSLIVEKNKRSKSFQVGLEGQGKQLIMKQDQYLRQYNYQMNNSNFILIIRSSSQYCKENQNTTSQSLNSSCNSTFLPNTILHPSNNNSMLNTSKKEIPIQLEMKQLEMNTEAYSQISNLLNLQRFKVRSMNNNNNNYCKYQRKESEESKFMKKGNVKQPSQSLISEKQQVISNNYKEYLRNIQSRGRVQPIEILSNANSSSTILNDLNDFKEKQNSFKIKGLDRQQYHKEGIVIGTKLNPRKNNTSQTKAISLFEDLLLRKQANIISLKQEKQEERCIESINLHNNLKCTEISQFYRNLIEREKKASSIDQISSIDGDNIQTIKTQNSQLIIYENKLIQQLQKSLGVRDRKGSMAGRQQTLPDQRNNFIRLSQQDPSKNMLKFNNSQIKQPQNFNSSVDFINNQAYGQNKEYWHAALRRDKQLKILDSHKSSEFEDFDTVQTKSSQIQNFHKSKINSEISNEFTQSIISSLRNRNYLKNKESLNIQESRRRSMTTESASSDNFKSDFNLITLNKNHPQLENKETYSHQQIFSRPITSENGLKYKPLFLSYENQLTEQDYSHSFNSKGASLHSSSVYNMSEGKKMSNYVSELASKSKLKQEQPQEYGPWNNEEEDEFDKEKDFFKLNEFAIKLS